MSEGATMEAAPAAGAAAQPAQSTSAPAAPVTPAPHQVPGLLGFVPGQDPKPAAPTAPAASQNPEPSSQPAPSDSAQPSPVWSKLVSDNPELKPYEKRLAHLGDTADAGEFLKALAKGYGESVAFKTIFNPGVDADPKDIAIYRKVNGIPAEAKDYAFTEATDKRFEAMGVKDPVLKSIYTEAAHKANATPAQFDIFSEAHEKAVGQIVEAEKRSAEAALQTNIDALKKDWGGSFDVNLGDAQKLHEAAFAGAKFTEAELKDLDAITKTTAYAKLMNSLGQRIPKEASIRNGAQGVALSAQSKLEAMKVAMRDPKHPASDHTHPDHHKALSELHQLINEGQGWIS